MPAQPEPGAEKDEPSRQRTHEGAEEVGKHRPLRPPREADPLPNEQGSYDQDPADHGNLAHAMPPPRIVRRPAYPRPTSEKTGPRRPAHSQSPRSRPTYSSRAGGSRPPPCDRPQTRPREPTAEAN